MAKKKDPLWMSHLKIKEGAFTKKAAKKGETVAQYANEVLKSGSQADTKTKRQANLAKVFSKVARKRKKKGGA